MQPQVIGLAEAAKVSGVSESTIRRRRADLLELGAVQGPKGWQIPIPALITLGLMSNTTAPDTLTAPEPLPLAPVTDAMTPNTTAELEALRGALTAAEHRAALAEAVAGERAAQIADLRTALRMIEAPHPAEEKAVPPQAATAPHRRRWWNFS
jgi:hypothetical protein